MSYNRLANETSPYLLQHKNNPVHWWPWGPEALAEAKRTGKPVLLSVGYAACHWCHVMAHESFENEDIAKLMNELFVNIKVDREERPDVDSLYMTALHHLGEQGGWPLTMFLTPEGEPFWGGTYFPPEPRFGRPGFSQLLREVARVYTEEPEKIQHNVGRLREALSERPAPGASARLSETIIADLARRLTAAFDPIHGGLMGAPKFPNCSILAFLWKAGVRYGIAPCLQAVETTLTRICQGGIYDHLGGGFARYSVDARWLVPHFEKMLYDNAQLIDCLAEAWKHTRDPLFATRIAETADWLLREMRVDGGGFASSYDADSEGKEGKFYVWSRGEILDVLGEADGAFFCDIYDVTEGGNWEGHNILNRLQRLEFLAEADEQRLAVCREKLMAVRAKRVRPGWDDKVLADWNGLVIAALTKAAAIFDRPDWRDAALKAYSFIKSNMASSKRLQHSWRAGQAKTPGIASDYANMITAALILHQSEGSDVYLQDAKSWAETLEKHFAAENGGYYLSADDTTDVIIRTLAAHDDATPNANAVMLANLSALYLLTGKPEYRARARHLLDAFSGLAAERFTGYCGLMAGALDLISPIHIAVIEAGDGAGTAAMRRTFNEVSIPGAVIQFLASSENLADGLPASGKTAVDGKATAYICVGQTCSLPVTDATQIKDTLGKVLGRTPSAG